MIAGFIIGLAFGSVFIISGLLIWKKQKISLVHTYLHKKVKKDDISAYTRLWGIGLLLIGSGICVTGLLTLLKSSFWWIPMLSGFASSLTVISIALIRYNCSRFQ